MVEQDFSALFMVINSFEGITLKLLEDSIKKGITLEELYKMSEQSLREMIKIIPVEKRDNLWFDWKSRMQNETN